MSRHPQFKYIFFTQRIRSENCNIIGHHSSVCFRSRRSTCSTQYSSSGRFRFQRGTSKYLRNPKNSASDHCTSTSEQSKFAEDESPFSVIAVIGDRGRLSPIITAVRIIRFLLCIKVDTPSTYFCIVPTCDPVKRNYFSVEGPFRNLCLSHKFQFLAWLTSKFSSIIKKTALTCFFSNQAHPQFSDQIG